MPGPKKRPRYAPEYKRQLLDLVRMGRKFSELAKEFGVHETTIRDWWNRAEIDGGRVEGATTDERAELVTLRRENAQLREEREILKKFAAWSAQESNWMPKKGSGS